MARQIKAVVSSVYLASMHLEEDLVNPSWWHRKGFANAIQQGTVQVEIDDFVSLMAVSLVVYPFSLFEAGIRRILRAIDPSACNGGTAEFRSIYDWLFARLQNPDFNRDEETAFLDLYRSMRNTLHNNGRFYSRNGGIQEIHWRGTNYVFEDGKWPAFSGWPINFMLFQELVRLNESVMKDPIIATLDAML